MNRKEFLEDLVSYYSVNPGDRRCSVKNEHGTFCYYSPFTAHKQGLSEGCAIGRHLPEALRIELDVLSSSSPSDWLSVSSEIIFNRLPKWMRDLGADFLMSCQRLHDTDFYWDQAGLSQQGSEMVVHIRKEFLATSRQ